MKIKIIFLFSFFLLLKASCFAQSEITDSLISAFQTSESDTAKITIMLKISDYFSETDPDSAIVWLNNTLILIDKALNKSFFPNKEMETKLFLKKSSSINLLGYCYLEKGYYKKALAEFEKGALLLTELNNTKFLPITIMNKGICYKELGMLDSAIFFYNSAIELYTVNNDSSGLMKVFGNKGVAFQRKGDYKEAITCYFEVANYSERQKDYKMNFIALNNIEFVYYMMDDKRKAIEYFIKCAGVLLKTNNKTQLPIINSNLSSLYYELGEKDKALDYYQ